MKEYIVMVDPFVMDQNVYECVDGQIKPIITFQLSKIETYVPFLQLFNQAKDEQIIINLKCPKTFSEKIIEKISTYCNSMKYNLDNIIIKNI